jgi:hypothetical protein
MANLRELGVADLWRLVETAFDGVREAYNAGKFAPLLEADVAGYIYHALVTALDGDASRVHLDTRLVYSSEKSRYDVAIGKCVGTDEQKREFIDRVGDKVGEAGKKAYERKSMRAEFRPAVQEELVLEIKMFAAGFTPDQLFGRLKSPEQGILKDMRKLAVRRSYCPDGRALVLFDDHAEHGYLTPLRQREILDAGSKEDVKLRFYLLQRNSAGKLAWDLLKGASGPLG